MTLVQLGRRNEAIRFLQEVLQSEPQNTAIRTHLSLLLASSKQLQEALQVLNGADESKSEVWFAKGNILKDLNQLDDAAEVVTLQTHTQRDTH
jgi:tetratricopeptide (TPR) repeat protein